MILNEAQQQIRDMARDFARERLSPALPCVTGKAGSRKTN